MIQSWNNWYWVLGLESLIQIGGAFVKFQNCAFAQLVPDATLGSESSVVIPQAPGSTVDLIQGGATRGANLFHSFEQFSVPTGSEAFFNNALDIQNIISRVTGESISNIDGLLRANGTANLFLLNPNGIIFGPNASLDIGGSFVGSTASSLNFADGTQFSATAPQARPLLTISVPIGLGFGSNPGAILVQGDGQGLRLTSDIIDTTAGLRVQPNQTLALVGGDIALERGTLKTAGGRIELGSVDGSNLISLTPIEKGWAFGYVGVQNFRNIQLSQQSAVDASGVGGGDVQVRGRQILLTDGSQIESSTLRDEAGGTLNVVASESVEAIGVSADGQFSSGLSAYVYPETLASGGNLTLETRQLVIRDGAQISTGTFGSGAAGNLVVNALDSVELSGTNAGLFTAVQQGATGDGGNLTLEARQLIVRNGTQISAITFGEGTAGNLVVKALDSVELSGTNTGLFTSSRRGATGNGGYLSLETGRLSVRNGAQISTGTFGSGSAGTLVVNALDSVELSGTNAGLLTSSQQGARGNGGDLNLQTGRLSVRDGAQISTGTFGSGAAGTLVVNALDSVELSGTNTGLFTSVEQGATGDGRNLSLQTGRLVIRDGAQISASTFGSGSAGNLAVNALNLVELSNGTISNSSQQGATGDGGNLSLQTGRLSVRDGAQISTGTFGSGAAGNLAVNALDSVELSGTNAGLFTSSQRGATGDGGDLSLQTGRLVIWDRAQIGAGTFGSGSAGTLVVNALDSVELSGTNAGLFTSVEQGATGDGGDLSLQTGRLSVRDGAQILASTSGEGSAGSLAVNAKELVELSGQGSSLSAQATGSSPAGSLTVNTKQLTVEDGAELTVSSPLGQAGNLRVMANSLLMDQGNLTAITGQGESGANVTLKVQDLLLMRRNSQISAEARGIANGGNITIDTSTLAALQNSDITANAFEGWGGNIQINTQGIFRSPGSDITATSQLGINGTVQINTPDTDPSRALANLPAEPVDATALMAQGCPGDAESTASKFLIVGRGGLPDDPSKMLSGGTAREDWGMLTLASAQSHSAHLSDRTENRSSRTTVSTHPTAPKPAQIVEAQGWVINAKGEVVLTANAPNVTAHNPGLTTVNCHT